MKARMLTQRGMLTSPALTSRRKRTRSSCARAISQRKIATTSDAGLLFISTPPPALESESREESMAVTREQAAPWHGARRCFPRVIELRREPGALCPGAPGLGAGAPDQSAEEELFDLSDDGLGAQAAAAFVPAVDRIERLPLSQASRGTGPIAFLHPGHYWCRKAGAGRKGAKYGQTATRLDMH